MERKLHDLMEEKNNDIKKNDIEKKIQFLEDSINNIDTFLKILFNDKTKSFKSLNDDLKLDNLFFEIIKFINVYSELLKKERNNTIYIDFFLELFLYYLNNKERCFLNFSTIYFFKNKLKFKEKINILDWNNFEIFLNYITTFIEDIIVILDDVLFELNPTLKIEKIVLWIDTDSIISENKEKNNDKKNNDKKNKLSLILFKIINIKNKDIIIFELLSQDEITFLEDIIILLEDEKNEEILKNNTEYKNIHNFLISIQINWFNIKIWDFLENNEFKISDLIQIPNIIEKLYLKN